ncbi:nicotinamide riboside transporter PnuC [Streptomyces sp. NPDC059015]|uniref:nicotinamide riboside transporter PnuC n=1 Tax=unclassified Streptomyces TaxID=2593676 RepID=UPI00369290F5
MSLSDVLVPLQQPLFTLLGTPVSGTEVLGFGSGALCVWLVARQHIANWPVGIANNVLFVLLFTQAGLYADAGLQVVFITLAVYGWWTWTHGGGPGSDALPVRRTTRTEWTWLIAAGVVGTVALTLLLDRATDSDVPFWDALTTALSLTATYGQCRKRLESWWLWIAADVVYVPLYVYKELYLTALLYIGFMTLCVLGLRHWSRDLAARRPLPVPTGGAKQDTTAEATT